MFAKIHSYILAVLLTAALAGVAASCSGSGSDEPGNTTELRLRLLTSPLPVDTYKQMLSFDADASWTITSSADWLLLSKATSLSSGSEDAAGMQTLSGEGSEAVVVISLANADENSRNATITLKSGKNSKVLEVTQNGTKSGEVTTGGSSSLAAGWLELPQTSATDGLDAYTVRFSDNSRSYTFYWDYSTLVSNWVAYPLNNSLIGQSMSRTNAWAFCPLLPANKQQDVSRGYRDGNHGWYARGHQLPSADRLGTFARNAQTFYGVNMTPQNNDFNGALWASLEGKVRSWATKTYTDTLYVVTGCVTTGAKYYVLDAASKKITVPTAYFKAVLLHEKSNSSRFSDYGGYAACAFWFDHEEYSAAGKYNASFNFDNMAISVKDLEAKLGYKLFVNLDKKAGTEMADKIKARAPKESQGW
ncbi:MAG: DNA/RNA non-specific endonuclease [Bacteroidales bacterium]|nr:DNA/RNA non-specific endonuclease [Bacteroidales bacterium]